MNDDEQFFKQFQEAPTDEFTEALYQRINQPMNAQRKTYSRQNALPLRRTALTAAAVFALLLAVLFTNPSARAQALSLLRQIGAFTITTETPAANLPTALPPDPAQPQLEAQNAAEAGTLAGFPVLAPQRLPDGYAAAGPLSILPNGNGQTVASAFTNPTGENVILINQYQYQTGDAFTDNVTAQETLQDVQVRGQPGVWISGRLVSGPLAGEQVEPGTMRATNWLLWEEDGIVYTIISDALTLEETLRLASDLK